MDEVGRERAGEGGVESVKRRVPLDGSDRTQRACAKGMGKVREASACRRVGRKGTAAAHAPQQISGGCSPYEKPVRLEL